MNVNLNSKSFVAGLAAILVVALTAVYWNHFDNGFHFDDSHTIVNNSYIKDLNNFSKYFTDGTTNSSLPTNQSYRPLVTLSAAIDYRLAGNKLDPFYFQLSTFLWVVLQGILMFFLFRRILRGRTELLAADLVSLFAVAWYVLHTANAESINYISARSDIISTVFVVAALVVYQYSAKKWRLASLLLVALGILTKPTAVMYIAILYAYIQLIEKDENPFSGDILGKFVGSFKGLLAALVVCFAMFLFTQHMEPDTWVPGGGSRFHYLITQPFVILRYFWTFFIPVGLSADTDWALVNNLFDYRFLIGTAFLLLFAVVVVYTAKDSKTRPISFGLVWFIVTLIPTSSIIPLAEVTNDHRMYYPFVGLALAASWTFYLVFQYCRERVGDSSNLKLVTALFGVVILSGNAFGTYQRNQVWSSEESLWLDVTIKSPKNGRGLMNYGLARMRVGDYRTAIDYYNRAFSTEYGNHPYLSLNMAICQDAVGNTALARKYYEESIGKGASYPDCHYFYAKWLVKQGDNIKAKYHLQEVLRLSPGHEYAAQLLTGLNTGVQNDLASREELVRKEPTAERYLNLSLDYYRLRRFEDCISACEKAIELRPDYAEAYNNICSAYNELQQYEKAVAACQKALAILPEYELAKNNLNWSLKSLNK